jgi:predicted NUDIX family NTP pyrophosphohydrolase
MIPRHVSAGLLLFRRRTPGVELFLAHPGGPFWKDRDLGVWTLPKGAVEAGEDLLEAAVREFSEETGILPSGPYLELGHVWQKGRKQVHAWAWEGDADPADVRSNLIRIRVGGGWVTAPEVDRCEWFDPETARAKLIAAQAEFVDRLLDALSEG